MNRQQLPRLAHPKVTQMRAAWKRILWRLRTGSLGTLKRSLDLVLVVPALLALLPLFIGLALAIRLHDGGPVLYWQKRVGLRGKLFDFPKFRSMCVNAEAVRLKLEKLNQHGAEGVTFKMRHDPRITPIGRFIRRFSIDELPQLWCILKGDMTLVGPRPPIPSEVAKYKLRERGRLSVVPGLTCFWQVNGRSEIPFEQQVEMDIDYIHQRSVWVDFKLLLRTIPAVLWGRGAY